MMLLPSYVEIRELGVVKKKIRIHGKSFDYVLGELELYFRTARKMLRPGLLEEVLLKIGLPKADIILPSGQTPPQKEEKKTEEKKLEPPEEVEVQPEIIEDEVKKEEDLAPLTPKTVEEAVVIKPEPAPEVIEKPAPEIKKVSEVPEAPVIEEKKPSIRISVSGVDDIVASSKTYVTAPNHVDEIETEVESEEVKVEPEEPPDIADSEEVHIDAEVKDETTPEIETSPEEESDTQVSIEHVITEVEDATETDAAVIRAITDAKALILGEDVVGRSTLLSTAGFEPVKSEEDADELPYHYKRVLKLKEHRVCLDVWHFDEAVKAGIQRKEFYESPDVVLVVYSVVDRWSFESLTYWLKEIAVTNEILPPIVIVGNKADLRTDTLDDAEEPPISEQEGFDYADELATTLGRDGVLHPVAFIETSCVAKDKVDDAFSIAAELFIKHRK